jgi:TatD DNase family protein
VYGGSRVLKVQFLDSHAHLADPAFDIDRVDVTERARAAGCEAIVCIGESIDAAFRAREIANAQPGFVYYTAGVHPHDAASFEPSRDLSHLESLLANGARAVGECGLDYHYDNSPRAAQLRAFELQLELAARMRRPVVVHTRDAEEDTRLLVQAAGSQGVVGVLHCYTGTRALAEAALAAGWYVSFSGIITFKNWKDEAILRLIPNDRLLAESDSPYLAPVPHRGKRNEPAWVALTVGRLATTRGTSAEEVGALVTANARRFFALDREAATALHRHGR